MRISFRSGMAAAGLGLALALAGCRGGSSGAPPAEGAGTPPPPATAVPVGATVVCKDIDRQPMPVPPKTITVRNNTAGVIHPVLATSTNAVNEWVQGCLRSTEAMPTTAVYKLYVNEGEGLAPGAEVTIALPLYSELAPRLYITWWNGGRVLLADRPQRLRRPADAALPTPDGVACQGRGTVCRLSTHASPVQFPEDAFAQLSEYTFGDAVTVAGQTERLLKPENVGYNISYVDHVYMPVAIGVRGNPYIGYSGSAQGLGAFRGALRAFLNGLGAGWPVYNMSELRLPGGYNVFAQRGGFLVADADVPVQPPDGQSPPVLTVKACIDGGCTPAQQRSLQHGPAVQNMQDLWGACVDWGAEDISGFTAKRAPADCSSDAMRERLNLVRDFFAENHRRYLALHASGACAGGTPQIPVFTYAEAIKHIYGWVPFNEGCGAGANPLSHTSVHGQSHAAVQALYIQDLQYNHRQAAVQSDPRLTFNPYVKLIHDDLGMSAYGFSVDDAVGFMSELGSGLVFAVGGVQGLENPRPFNYADGFSLLLGAPAGLAPNRPLIQRYGACSLGQEASDPNCDAMKQDVGLPTNSQIVGFRVGTPASYPLKLRFTDVEGNVYTVLVREKFAACTGPLDACPANRAQIVDGGGCSVRSPQGSLHPKSAQWCGSANPNQGRDNDQAVIKNYLSYAVPVRYLP